MPGHKADIFQYTRVISEKEAMAITRSMHQSEFRKWLEGTIVPPSDSEARAYKQLSLAGETESKLHTD